MAEHTEQAQPNTAQTKVTVAEAAQLLGLSAEAVRSRVQRGTLKSTKEGNTVYVLLDEPAQTRPNTDETHARTDAQAHPNGDQTEFILNLQGQIDWLRGEVERKDTLLMTLMQRIPELEAPRGARGGRSVDAERESGSETPSNDTGDSQRSSFWRRLFLGEQ